MSIGKLNTRWLYFNTDSMVCLGKSVGKMPHVAAKALVAHNTPDYVSGPGVPARVVKEFK